MKNYKLIYDRLIKVLKSEQKLMLEIIPTLIAKNELIDKIEYEGQEAELNWILNEALPELEGKILCCWCKPELCHVDVLVELLEQSKFRTAKEIMKKVKKW